MVQEATSEHVGGIVICPEGSGVGKGVINGVGNGVGYDVGEEVGERVINGVGNGVGDDVGEGVDATPAPSGDSLFVRGERRLFRFAAP